VRQNSHADALDCAVDACATAGEAIFESFIHEKEQRD
jgi:hypothetical protein